MGRPEGRRAGTKKYLSWIKLGCLGLLVALPLEVDVLAARLGEITSDNRGIAGGAIFCALWVMSTAALITTAYVPALLARLSLAFVLVPSTLASTTYWSITHSPLSYGTMETWWEERALYSNALSAYSHVLPYTALMCVIAVLAIALPPDALLLRRVTQRLRAIPRRWRKPAMIAFSVAPWPVLCALNVAQAGEGLRGMPVHFKGSVFMSVFAFNKFFVERERTGATTRIALSPPKGDRPNVLFVVNESVRGDYLDINNRMGVTPFLHSRRDRIANFGYASSMANCSSMTHQALRVGMHMDLPVESQQENPFIWQYAKQAGYRTVYIDAQVGPHNTNNSMGSYERSLIDEEYRLDDPLKDPELWSRDQRAQQLIERMLSRRTRAQPLFIYVVQFGSHLPYEGSFPESGRHFPDADSEGRALPVKQRVINSYKNSVRWSVDTFFKAMLAEGRRFPDTVVLYTSDHGQDMMDSNPEAGHCTVHDPDPHEGLVPLLAFTDHPVWAERLQQAAARNKNRASHFNLVPTMLEIFGFEREGINRYHGKSLVQNITEPRRFLSRGIRINMVSTGLENKLLWNSIPNEWHARAASLPTTAGEQEAEL